MHDPQTAIAFTQIDGIALVRVPGRPTSIAATVDAITHILGAAVAAGIDRLVIDASGLDLPQPPSLADRQAMVRVWAAAADGRVIVCLVCPVELIDGERFGVVAAANFGLHGNVFANVHDALDWVRHQ